MPTPQPIPEAALEGWLRKSRERIDASLATALERCTRGAPARLEEAMRYSLLGGGKRLRPVLVLAAAEAAGRPDAKVAIDFACAVELVHTYSLIHDDLPAMDDDDLRRGRPTSHRVFGEALAILAGDALLTEAFFLVGEGEEPSRAKLCALLAEAAGARGMVGGQVDDVDAGAARSLASLEELHRRKTGALFAAASAGGAIAAEAPVGEVSALRSYGVHLGLAFQIRDDLLDRSGDPRKTGKHGGGDARKGKVTFPSLVGEKGSLDRAHAEAAAAKEVLRSLSRPAPFLEALADHAVMRDR